MSFKKSVSLCCVFASFIAAGCTLTPDIPAAVPAALIVSSANTNDIDCSAGPDAVVVMSTNLVPEGVEFDPIQCRFLLGSITLGTVTAVQDDGAMTTLVDDDEVSSITGIHLDGRRLLVCLTLANGGPGFGIYDADDGSRIALVDLTELAGPGSHLINDCTADADGNALITDSMSPMIFRVTPLGEASVFAADPLFGGFPIGVNGIEFIPDHEVVVVGNTSSGALFRIPVDDAASFTQVSVDATINTDGMLLHPSGDLVITGSSALPDSSTSTGLISVSSTDGWLTATVSGSVTTSARPSTSALRGTDIYPIYPFLIESFTGTSVTQYPLIRVSTGTNQ